MSTAMDSHGRKYDCASSGGNPGPAAGAGISPASSPAKVIGGELISWSIIEIIGSTAQLCRPESDVEMRSSPPGGSTIDGHAPPPAGIPSLDAAAPGISSDGESPTLAVFEILGVALRRCAQLGSTSTEVRFFSRVVRFLTSAAEVVISIRSSP